MEQSLGSILTAIVTPFTVDQQIDAVSFARLADSLLAGGSDGLVVAGTTGESPTLTDDEKVELFRTAADVAHGRGTVVAGTGSNDTERSVRLTRRADDAGADAVLVVTPYYNRPPERGIVAHFEAVAAATMLPVIVYNIPSRCGVNLGPELLARLGEIDNIVAVKQANPDLDETRRLRDLSSMDVYAGNDDMLLDVLKLGGGAASALPVTSSVRRCANSRRLSAAAISRRRRSHRRRLASLYKMLFITTNPIPVKTALNLVGHEVGGLRLPLVEANDDERRLIEAELERQGLL